MEGGEGGGFGRVGAVEAFNTSEHFQGRRQGGGVGGGLGTHWKPSNTTKTLARAAMQEVGAVGALWAVGAVRAEGVWAHIGSL